VKYFLVAGSDLYLVAGYDLSLVAGGDLYLLKLQGGIFVQLHFIMKSTANSGVDRL
jgi:hypothetical protein